MRMQGGPLRDNEFLEANHRPDKNDYFFDRDPDAFKVRTFCFSFFISNSANRQ